MHAWTERLRDPRWMQIGFLTSFLLVGVTLLGFDVPFWQPPLIVGTACLVQWGMTRALRVPDAGYLSPVITGLGLSLLLRTDAAWVGPFAAFVAISAKFVLRHRGKHLFNPTNLGIVVAMLLTGHAWCSPSQWGTGLVLAGWFAVFGFAVAHRSFRSDVSAAFLLTFIALKTGRVLYLNAPLDTLWHQLASGSLIVFTFFMISDPKTTPDHRVARVLYGAAVAVLGFVFLHELWWQNALLWALCLLSPLVPLLDRLLRSERFVWPGATPLPRKEARPCAEAPSLSLSRSV